MSAPKIVIVAVILVMMAALSYIAACNRSSVQGAPPDRQAQLDRAMAEVNH